MTFHERLKFLAESWIGTDSNRGPVEFTARFFQELEDLERAIQEFQIVAPGDRAQAFIALEGKLRTFEGLVIRSGAFPGRLP